MPQSKQSTRAAQAKRKKTLAQKKKIREQEYRQDLKTLKRVGAYSPKSSQLTKYRKSIINKRKREFGDYLDSDKFFFIPIREELRSKALPIVKDINMPHTRKGIFYEKAGSKRAFIRKSKSHPDELEIHFSGKVKEGRRGERIDEYDVPLAKLDKMLLEKDYFRRKAASYGQLKKNERLAFKVMSVDPAGLSRNIYSDIEDLINDLEKYENNVASKLGLFRHIVIVKTTAKEWRAEKVARGLIPKRDRRHINRPR